MSHYLGHIANLALNRVPVVQPRLASRFEASAGFAPVAEDNQERVTEVRATHRETAQPEQQRPIPTNRREAESPSPVPVHAFQSPVAEPQVTRPHQPVVEQDAQTRAAPEPQILVQQLIRERIHEQPLLTPAPIPKGLVLPESERSVVREQIERSLLVEHRYESPSNTAEVGQANVQSEPQREAASVASKAPQIQTRIAVPEPVSQTIAQRPSLQAEVAAPAPSIQVSIGRIEIRANPASSQAPKSSSKPATLSLDDYLKQRKGDR